jgi:hypothetical protein
MRRVPDARRCGLVTLALLHEQIWEKQAGYINALRDRAVADHTEEWQLADRLTVMALTWSPDIRTIRRHKEQRNKKTPPLEEVESDSAALLIDTDPEDEELEIIESTLP